MKQQNGIFGLVRLNEEKYLNEFFKYYRLGLSDIEIGEKLGLSKYKIAKWRYKYSLKTNFRYTRKFNTDKFKLLYNKGLNYSEIARELKVSDSAIQEYASSNGYTSNYHKYELTEFSYEELQVFIGTVYGDASLSKNYTNAQLSFAHSLKQTDYCMYKYKILKRFCKTPIISSIFDKRTNKFYNRIDVRTGVNPLFTKYYDKFYKDKIKYINEEVLYQLDPLGIAIWYMDDGCKHSNHSYSLSTNCFTKEDLEKICKFFEEKFNLHFHIMKNHTLYLISKDARKFEQLIADYIHPDCKYKLWYSLNSVKQGKSEKDVPVPNPRETEEKAKRLDVIPNEKDEDIKSSTKAGHCSE